MRVLVAFLMILTVAACQKEATRSVSIETSPNGHAFAFMPIDEEGVTDVTITIAWPHAWPYDGTRNPAVPYVGTQLIHSGGTEALQSKEIGELFQDKNAVAHLYARADHVIGELSFPQNHQDIIIPIVAELLAQPQFEPKWIDRIKRNTYQNQAQASVQTANKMWMVGRAMILGDSPLYEFTSMPDLDRLLLTSRGHLTAWHQETLVQEGAVIAVAGAITAQRAGEAVDALLAGLPVDGPEIAPRPKGNYAPRKILLHVPQAKKTTLGFLGSVPSTDQNLGAVELLITDLFGMADGPLFTAIRTDMRASYGFQVGATNIDRANRVMFINGEVEPKDLNEAVERVLRAYDIYRRNPDLTGLEALKVATADRVAKNVQYVDVAARIMLEAMLDGVDPALAVSLPQSFHDVTEDEFESTLRTYFPQDLIIVAASADATALTGACVITKPQEVANCP